MKIKLKHIVLGMTGAVLLTVASVATGFASVYWDYLMGVFGTSNSNLNTETINNAAALGDDLVQEISEDAAVLLKNENNCLPLSEETRKVNLFGYGSTQNGFVYSGGGSSGTIINMDRAPADVLEEKIVSPVEAFVEEGFQVNQDLQKLYTDFSQYNATLERGINTIYQPPGYIYTHEILADAIRFSDTAVVFISRNGSESNDIPLTQSKNNGKNVTDSTRTYLQLTTEEEDMLDIVTDNFENVIVIINAGNPIECGFLNDEGIDAAFYVGLPGQSGTLAIPRLLKGYKTVTDENGVEKKVAVTPSGRLPDTYPYSSREYEPTDANMFPYPHVTYPVNSQISYTENIYVGYKWYETADAEGYFDKVDNKYGKGYDGVVQYPFGYGLSYDTDFEYKVTSSLENGSNLNANSKIEIKVEVTNTSKATSTGKDVVQLYFTPTYHEGEIEKSEVNLLAFAKTASLIPGSSQTLTFEIDPYDLACYDDYDRNKNNHEGYELDKGDYTISLRSDAHTVIECENSELTYKVSETINIDKDPVTNAKIENKFTGKDAYLGMPIDGSTAGGDPIKYLSRADFANTFPKERTPDRTDLDNIKKVNTMLNNRYDTTEMPTTGKNNNMYLVVKEDGSKASLADLQGSTQAKLVYNDDLILELGTNYDSEKWNDLLDQLSVGEMSNLLGNGFFGTSAIESVGKPQALDVDGPAGFHYTSASEELRSTWVAFPAEITIGCTWNQQMAFNMGQAQGVLAQASKINGWYGPGLNLHRNAYSGRYFEYYSEDPILVGKLGAETVRGATRNGLYCYMKHFAVSEEGVNPDNVKTWLTEQALRETYLKPFEIAVKEGEANAIMTAFNCIGAVWSGGCDPMNNDILRTEWGFKGSLITDWALGNRDWMDGEQGIRAGNDLWLDLGEQFGNNATAVTLMRNSTKNVLYTYANTYALAKDYQENRDEDDRYQVDIEVGITEAPFSPIPILMVAGVWLLALVGTGVCVYLIVKKPKQRDNK